MRNCWIISIIFGLICSTVWAQQSATKPTPPNASDAAAVLTHIRDALGLRMIAAHKTGIRLAGTEQHWGEDGRTEYVFDSSWHFTIERAARLASKAVCDGRSTWVTDIDGETRACWIREHSELLSELGAVTGLLLAEGAGIEYKIAPEQTTDAVVALFAGLDKGQTVAVVEVDRATWRPRRWQFVTGGRNLLIELDGVLEFGGVQFPHEARINGSKLIFATAADAAPDEHRFQAIPRRPNDTAFDPKLPADAEVKSTRDKRLLIRTHVNGKDCGWFLFDTGGQESFIDKALCAELGLTTFGSEKGSGIGPDAHQVAFARAKTMTVGPLTIHDPLLVVSDLNLAYLGENIRGVISYPVLARCVVEFEPGRPRLSLYNPDSYKLPHGSWTHLDLDRHMPILPGWCEQKRAILSIDTGGVSVVVNDPAVRAWKLLVDRKLTPEENQGFGGRVTLQKGTLKTFGIDPYVSVDVPALFATDPRGSFTDSLTTGSVGVEFLQSLVMVFDYGRQRAVVISSKEWGAAPGAGSLP